NKLLQKYFKSFGIPEEKRSNENLQREILKHLKQYPSTSFLNLFAETLGFFIRHLWIFFVDTGKCLGLGLIAPLVTSWDMVKAIKNHFKRIIFILKHKDLIKDLNKE
ncbi:MAG: hypothetical protein K2I71_08145, partial [Helicobacter sp.]|nr:hypothetical protein [Helicobacter sp.]